MRYILLVGLIFLGGNLYSQSTYELNVEEAPVFEVLSELENTYGLKFSYNSKKLKGETVTCSIITNDQNALVEEVFRYLPYKVSLTENVFLIIPDRNKKIKLPVINGKVINSQTGEPLAFAHIQTGNKGAITDLEGNFKLNYQYVKPIISVSYIGFKNEEIETGNYENLVTVELEPDSSQLPEIIINANSELATSAEVSTFHVNVQQLSSLPSLGQVDVFKSLQLIPGINATDETYSGLIVRGTGSEQNLVQMDGFTIYHLDHLFGIYSTFNPYTINQVDVYKGGFSASYGGRLSSVIDSKVKYPAKDRIHGGFNINPTSMNIYLESPIGKKIGVIASYRQSIQNLFNSNIYTDFIQQNRVKITDALESVEPIELTPDFRFYDLNAKIQYQPDEKNQISGNLFLSGDTYNGSFSIEEPEEFFFRFELIDEADWGNVGSSLNWDHFNNENKSNHFSVSYSSFRSLSELLISESFRESLDDDNDDNNQGFTSRDTTLVFSNLDKANYLYDFTAKWDQKLYFDTQSSLNFGSEVNVLQTDYSITYYDDWNESFDLYGTIMSAFADYNITEGRLDFSLGLRSSYYTNSEKFYFEPRIKANYAIHPNLRLKGAYSIHNQFLNRISITPFGNSDQFYWVLSDDDLYQVMNSQHWIGGLGFNKNKWSVDIEYYHKTSDGILESEYVLYSDFEGDEEDLDGFINTGLNTSQGVDVFVKYRSKKYTSWVSYSLSESRNAFETINQGNPYPSIFDQRHEINWVHQLRVGKWELGGTFIYGSGKPYTPPNPDVLDNFILYDVQQINTLRLPDYHRADLSIKYNTSIKSVDLSMGCTLFNIYNRENIKSRRYILLFEFNEDDEITNKEVVPTDITLLGFTPNFFLDIRF